MEGLFVEEPPGFLPARHECREVPEMTEQTEGAEATKQEMKDSIPETNWHESWKHMEMYMYIYIYNYCLSTNQPSCVFSLILNHWEFISSNGHVGPLQKVLLTSSGGTFGGLSSAVEVPVSSGWNHTLSVPQCLKNREPGAAASACDRWAVTSMAGGFQKWSSSAVSA